MTGAARLTLPLSVRTPHGQVHVLLEAASPVPWSRAHPHVLRAAGLPPGTPLYLGVGPVEPDWLVGSPPLLAGTVLDTAPVDDLPERPPVVLAVIAGPDAGRWWPLEDRPLVVGRDPRADLTLTDPQVSFRHALFRRTATGLAVIDLGSTNGIRVDGRPVGGTCPPVQEAGDSSRSGRVAATTGSLIRIGGTLLQIQLTVEPAGSLTPDGAGHLVRTSPAPRSPGVLPAIPDPPGPPPERRRRPIPLLAGFLGAIVGGALALVLGSPIYLAFAALGPVTMIGSAISDRISGRRSHRRDLAAHRAAVDARESAIRAAVTADRRRTWQRWPDPATLLRRIAAGSPRLWDRRPGDDDYLHLAVGAGTRRLPLGDGHTAVTDPSEKAPPVTDAPVTIDLPAAGVLGLVGDAGRALARWLLLQIAALHSPGDVALVVVSSGPDLRPCRDLPHLPGPGTGPPATATPGDDRGAIGDVLDLPVSDVVVVLDGPAVLGSPVGRATIAAAGTAGPPRVSVVCLAARPEDLPAGCARPSPPPPGAWVGPGVAGDAVQDAGSGPPGTGGPEPAGPVDVSGIDAEQFALGCRALAPLRDGTAAARGSMPVSLPLTDLTGPVDPAGLRSRWRHPSARAVLGAGTQGVAVLDLDADGPHLLIAGTTGAGKSELLQTLVAGLAIASPPSSLTFLLIDYKGGAAFETLADLPHVVGVVTDLDPDESTRALDSLRAELRQRERLAARPGSAPPRLVIVVDEFATLAAELPQFLSGLLDIVQRGRALGLHLVLATQRPAGVVSPAMRSNISARICLRVTDATDSVDIVDVPDAARISPRTPGRGLLRTGTGLQAFQSALVTVPPTPDLLVRPHGTDGPASDGADESVLKALVRAARGATTDPSPPIRPWLPPLPRRFRPDDAHPDALALADLPDQQARRLRALPDASVLVTGPPGSGRSTALRRIAAIAAGRGAELLVVDPAGSLVDLRQWSVVSSYLTLDHPRLILRLLTLLADPQRRAADGRPRWLIIDGYQLAAAALDRADYLAGSAALAELPARTAGAVRVAAAGPPSLLHQRHAGGFPTVISLDGGDTAPGRARWSGAQVQLADAQPGRAPRGHGPTGGAQPGRAPTGRAPWPDALVVRPLPDLVPLASLPSPRPGAVPLGRGGDDASPVTVDLQRTGGAIVVAGPRRSGVSSALAVLAGGASRCGIPVLLVHRGPGEPSRPPGGSVVDVRGGPEPLRRALDAHAGPLLLVVDQSGSGSEHPAGPLLERFCQVCGPGQHLVLGERLDVLARARRGHLGAALAFRRGVLLSPDGPDGALLDVALPRRTEPLPPGRGVWADAGRATPVQVATPV